MNNLSTVLLHFFSNPSLTLKGRSPVLIACSGGPDSVALVHAFAFLRSRMSFGAVVGHVNHQQRGKKSNQDERFVRDLARKLDLPYIVRKAPVQKGSGNLEEKLRVKRYAALGLMAAQVRAKLVLTAHTQDDQLETILMNLARGAGLSGAGGIPPLRKMDRFRFVGRPFIGVSKKEILKTLSRRKISFRKDHTNKDLKLTRNWVRQVLVPEWEKRCPGLRTNLIRFGRQARESTQFLEGVVSREGPGRASGAKAKKIIDYNEFSGMHPVLQRAFLRKGIGKDLLTFDTVERLRHWMARLPKGGRLFELKKGWAVERLPKSRNPENKLTFRIVRDLSRIQRNSRRVKTKQ